MLEFNRALLEGSRGVLVGYSGGADSTALLYLMKRECELRKLPLAAMHVNHGIRGGEALRDELHCREVCESLGIELTVIRADIPSLAEKLGKGLEETARDLRYEKFREALESDSRLDTVATAHNADDNAETLIFNLARGSGLAGLCGIPPERRLGEFRVIRPLLGATKREILAYCEKIGADYITDSTNSDTTYSRNFIRSELIPRLTELNPAFLTATARLTRQAREDSEYLDGIAATFPQSDDGSLDAYELARLERPIAARVLRRFASLEAVHIDAILTLLPRDGELSLPSGVRAEIKRGRLSFTRGEKLEPLEFNFELHRGINFSERREFAISVRDSVREADEIKKDNETLKNIYKLSIPTRLKSDTINNILFARSREPGDAYVSGGMTRRLKKLLNAKKLTELERRTLPVLCDSEGILAVPGVAVADRARGDDILITYYFEKYN